MSTAIIAGPPPVSAAPDIATRVARARAAQRDWSRLSVRQRLEPVRALRHLLVGEADALCAAVARDLGKSTSEVIGGELLGLADACRFLERQAARLLRPRRVPGSQRPLWMFGQSDTVHRPPRGVVGVIGTWNYPLFLNGVQFVQALTAGNAVVWKPSEVAPASAEALHGLVRRAGYPEELVQVLPATREGGAALLEADLDHVVFTGSVPTGRAIARRLGERLISSTLELSGCDAQFVLADADVAMAARAAWFGVTLNRGQTCIAVRRALVQRPVYPAFCDALRDLALKAAGPLPLALSAQARQAERLVRDAVAEGARLLVEPGAPADGDGSACRPAVLVDARPEMAVCREAAFAPVMAVLPFDTVDEALSMDAQCPFGLGASVFGGDTVAARELATRLRTGLVTVNDVIAPLSHPATPFGGRGESGWGTTQGAEGLLEMTVLQVVSVKGGRFRPHYDLAAGGNAAGQELLVRGLLESGHAPTLGGRLRGWWRALRGLRGGK
jgi:acyl-CoA reductase-like NAD-dependent aldehyde dehydrogenase